MTVYYTTAVIVRARAKNIGAADPSDAEIEEYIAEAEGLVDAMLGFSLQGNFSSSKSMHLLVRQVTTDIAAFYAIAHDPSGFTSTGEAALILDVIYTNMLRGLTLLKDKRIQQRIQEA